MPTILITRPLGASKTLAQELLRCGYDSVIEPLLTIISTNTSCPDVKNIQAVMITSAHALQVLNSGQAAAFLDLPCFCVGPRTADRVRDFGFSHVQSAASDGIELAQLIRLKGNRDGGPILHISGRDVDSKAQDELQRMGFKVVSWVVYTATPAAAFSEQTVALLEKHKLDAVLVYSARTAETLKTLLVRQGLDACCENLIAIGLSETVGDVLKSLPWRQCVTAAVPTEDAVITLLKKILPVS